MKELTIIKRGDAAYIDSREVAEIIGKRHDNLLRDIEGYLKILRKFTDLNFEGCEFFVENSYLDPHGRKRLCYLISRRGADIIANKLTGERGVLFTAVYVTKFHEMSERERANEIAELAAQAVTPKLAVFNTAVRNVLGGMTLSDASPKAVMDFLRGAYKPFGIAVKEFGGDSRFYSATFIASVLDMYSSSGKPHAQAVSAIIEKFDFDPEGHIEIVPYGLIGFSVRYDEYIAKGVADWIEQQGYPRNIPHNGIEYHVNYEPPYLMYKHNCVTRIPIEIDLDDDDFDYDFGDEE
jgi:Rha family phage regulatory protein